MRRRHLRMVFAGLLLTPSLGCEESYCIIDEQVLIETDLNVWGTVVGEDMGELLGPFEGTWEWLDGRGVIDVPGAGMVIPATAYVEIDPSSYRWLDTEYVEGRKELFPERMSVCPLQRFMARGTMTIVDEDGATLAAVPLVIERTRGGVPYYRSSSEVTLAFAFSDDLQPLETFDSDSILVEVDWGTWDGPIHAEFDYSGRRALPDTPEGHSAGVVAFGDVAEFYQD